MSRELGRPGYGGDLPSHKPVEVILAVLMAVVGTGVILLYQYEREWSFVRRLYLPTYPRDGPGSRGTVGDSWPCSRRLGVTSRRPGDTPTPGASRAG